jgi:8-oxo-dGTP diphosphatase
VSPHGDTGRDLRGAVLRGLSGLASKVRPVRRPRRARVFVVSAGGSVALIERRKPGRHYWVVPGGGIEPGETPVQAAVREVREELGLDVVLDGRWRDRRGPQVFYLARVASEQRLSLGGPERERNRHDNSHQPVWVPLDAAATLWLRPPGAAEALARLRRTAELSLD